MDCNTGQRKAFADDVIASLQEVLKKHEVDEVVVHRETNPMVVVARGLFKGKEEDESQRVELVLQISPDLRAAEKLSQQGASSTAAVPAPVARAFDISQIVARDTVAAASADFENSSGSESHHGR